MADEEIVLSGVPFFPGGRVPEGWVSLIMEIVELNEDAPPQEVAESIAEQAIEQVFRQVREEEDGVREPYKTMMDELRVQQDRQALVNVRRTFGNIVNEHHSAFIEQQEQEDEDDLDPDKCQHVKDDGEQCGNDRPEEGDYCHVHTDDEDDADGDGEDDDGD